MGSDLNQALAGQHRTPRAVVNVLAVSEEDQP